MATIVLSAVGTAIGGPIGGSIGSLIGSQIDQAIFKPSGREGPRLKELQVTTSSYGTPIARHFGRIRTPGSIIWATDLTESSEKSGNGKGKPSTTTFTYSASFAVALASRPIKEIGRIWADGNLLRGVAGDLKAGGEIRLHNGHGDQPVDPLIASDRGSECPAFRGLAYCVFESLQLADFGNRIPTLTFEVIADDGEVSLANMIPALEGPVDVNRPLGDLAGFSEDGGPLAASLESIGQVYPFSCDASGAQLTIQSSDSIPSQVPMLPEAAVDASGDGFGTNSGESRRRQAESREIPEGLRYYDLSRDFQAGLQRADGRARPGRSRIIEFPGSLDAGIARNLANSAAERAASAKELISWRLAELDPALAPGLVVSVPGKAGYWRIENWEWRDSGIELELLRLPHGPARTPAADSGQALAQSDQLATPTILHAYELPWDGNGSGSQRQAYAAASSNSAGWNGAALFSEDGGSLSPLGSTGRQRSIVGQLVSELGTGNSTLIDRQSSLDVELISEDFQLLNATMAGLANGANRALIGSEIIQFATASRIDGNIWRLTTLLRGRGGSESLAQAVHSASTPFVLLDDKPVPMDPATLGQMTSVAATGLADTEPVLAPIEDAGRTLKPITPVHPQARRQSDGSLLLCWTRRARGGWEWRDLVDAPLNEQMESYLIGLGDTQQPVLRWEVTAPSLEITAATIASLQSQHAGSPLWVRQIGSHAASDPLLLHMIA